MVDRSAEISRVRACAAASKRLTSCVSALICLPARSSPPRSATASRSPAAGAPFGPGRFAMSRLVRSRSTAAWPPRLPSHHIGLGRAEFRRGLMTCTTSVGTAFSFARVIGGSSEPM